MYYRNGNVYTPVAKSYVQPRKSGFFAVYSKFAFNIFLYACCEFVSEV